MTKTKKQLRAEAVERLRSIDYPCGAIDVLCVALGFDFVRGRRITAVDVYEPLVDLLTDDEPIHLILRSLK